mmetsp:Transcript_16001/g.32807  ORF Transcript_16001/g.32807 Transcript_16001/m.32807 type:complete len:209 (+) Transcript_16001:168-794(+)
MRREILCFFRSCYLQNSQQFNIKIQSGSSGNDTTGTTISVCETSGKNDLSTFADLHLRESFVPSSNNLSLSNREGERSATISGRVEFSDRIKSIEPSGVVGFDGLSLRRDGSGALLQNFVLEAGFGRDESIGIYLGGRFGDGFIGGNGGRRVQEGSGGRDRDGGSRGSCGADKRSAVCRRHRHGEGSRRANNGKKSEEGKKLGHFGLF